MRMARNVFRLCVTVLLAAIPSGPLAAAPVRLHTVQNILQDGKAVPTAQGVKVTSAAGKVENVIRRGEAVPDGTRVDVPARVVITVVSAGGKSTATLETGSSVTFVSTGSG